MISSLSNRGRLRFMVYDGALNTRVFLKFLRRLVRVPSEYSSSSTICVSTTQDRGGWVKANEEKIS